MARKKTKATGNISNRKLLSAITTIRRELKDENKRLLELLMQEIVDIRRELKEDILGLDQKLYRKIEDVDKKLEKRMDALSADFQVLRMEVHQNQATFITNHDALERRVAVLETA